jgi:hypothetical protein
MKHLFGRAAAAALLLLALGAPAHAQGIEEATAITIPWSGWWWPAKTGSMVLGYRGEPGALVKQDRLTGKQSATWEQHTYYHFNPAGADWWGHCHAWAAASLLEKQPVHDVFTAGTPFHVGDLKALLTEAHYSDRATFFGKRFNGQPGDDPQDMSPLLVWYVLRKFVAQDKTGVVFDLNPGPEVWSYPCFKYQLSYQPMGNGSFLGQLSIWVATFQVHPDVVGTVPEKHDYTFTFQANGSQLIFGSDHWTGRSVDDHPDFAWYPTARAQDNPELDYNFATTLSNQAR